jgi:hypothetical protein
MRRRRFLSTVGAAATLGLAGCAGSEGGDGGDSGTTDSPTARPTTTDRATTNHTTTDRTTTNHTTKPTTDTIMTDPITSETFAVTDSGCGQQVNETTVTFDSGDRTVTVTGTIHGSDTTKTAQLRSASYDAAADRLTVTVETTRRTTSTTVVGAQCIVEIDYEATITLESLPGEVAVVHDSAAGESTVTTTDRPTATDDGTTDDT